MRNAALYYGNGECSIEGEGITGVQIFYKGKMTLEQTAHSSYHIGNENNMVLIFSFTSGEGYLGDLFNYLGEFKISSVIVSNELGERIPCTVNPVLDYSEMIRSTSESLTVKSEDLSASYKSTKIKTGLKKKTTIDNLKTTNSDSTLYLGTGEEYSGDYHIHIKSGTALTGGIPSEKSQDLYFKQIIDGVIVNELIATRNYNDTAFSKTPKPRFRKGRPLQIGENVVARRTKKRIKSGKKSQNK